MPYAPPSDGHQPYVGGRRKVGCGLYFRVVMLGAGRSEAAKKCRTWSAELPALDAARRDRLATVVSPTEVWLGTARSTVITTAIHDDPPLALSIGPSQPASLRASQPASSFYIGATWRISASRARKKEHKSQLRQLPPLRGGAGWGAARRACREEECVEGPKCTPGGGEVGGGGQHGASLGGSGVYSERVGVE